jgi:CRP/FNR family transcriptional regulator
MSPEVVSRHALKPVLCHHPVAAKSLATNRPACSTCRLQSGCLAAGLSASDLERFGTLVSAHRRLAPGQSLYRSGVPLDALYVVRSGFVKTVVLLDDGREQVTGFFMAGNVLGIDAIGSGIHASDAVALDDCDLCVIPYERLARMSRELQPLQRQVHRMFSQEIVREQGMMFLLGSMSAEERVASFLLNLSKCFTARGFSPSEFLLRMTREEIGSFLGLKLETVSRTFSKLHKVGVIEVEGKHVRIVRMSELIRIIGR